MTSPPMLETGPAHAAWQLMLAHGAGAAMDSPFLEAFTALLSGRGIASTRFEFAYMATRRSTGKKKVAPKAEMLVQEYANAIAHVRGRMTRAQRLFIGGKSMGGRVASLIADDQHATRTISGLVCLGYPFHPPNMPEKLRTAHLVDLKCPTLIVQGDRDPFGGRDEIEAMTLSAAIEFHWAADGDHDFGPRGASGHSRRGNLEAAADAVAAFIARAAV
jgi:uncharacterized protein